MAKMDLKKIKPFYTASTKEAIMVSAWPLKYLMFNGYGDPDTNPDFKPGWRPSIPPPIPSSSASSRNYDKIGPCPPWRASGGCSWMTLTRTAGTTGAGP